MTTIEKHSPVPWQTGGARPTGFYTTHVPNGRQVLLGECFSETNTAFVVKAVNAYNDHLEIIKEIAGGIASAGTMHRARQAIAIAEGK